MVRKKENKEGKNHLEERRGAREKKGGEGENKKGSKEPSSAWSDNEERKSGCGTLKIEVSAPWSSGKILFKKKRKLEKLLQ